MSWLHGARARFVLLFARRTSEARIQQELEFHVDMEARRLVREAGVDPDEARRQALVAFGGVEKHREDLRDGRGVAWLGGFSLDVKLGVRMLVKYPGLTVVGCLALSIAIAAGAGYLELIRKVYNPVLPIDDGDRVVAVQNWDAEKGQPDRHALHDFVSWRGSFRSLDELGATQSIQRNVITDDGRAEPSKGAATTASMFRLVRMAPIRGRVLVDDDERTDAPGVVVLSHTLWHERFAGDSNVVGRTIRLGRLLCTVIGVMPGSYPSQNGFWIPLRVAASDYPRGEGPEIAIYGRLAPGATLETAQAELTAAGQRTQAAFPETNKHLRPVVRPFLATDSEERMALYAINLFFVLLLGVCCANVATLVFARTATREGELTVRTALGASRWRIVSQLFTEALVLVSLSAIVGLAGAWAAVTTVKRAVIAAGVSLPPWWTDGMSPATIVYVVVLTIGSAVIVGGWPALKATGRRLQDRLKNAGTGGSRMQFGRMWTGVIVAQVGLTVMFLLLIASIAWNARIGRYLTRAAFPAAPYLTARLSVDDESGPSRSRTDADVRQRIYDELERRLSADPRVAGVTFTTTLPATGHPRLHIEIEGASTARAVRGALVAPDFLATLGRPLLTGRDFTTDDLAANRTVAIVDETFARRVLGDVSPIGQRVRQAASSDAAKPGAWYEIVGVVGALAVVPDSTDANAVFYRPVAASDVNSIYMIVRATGDPQALAPALRSMAAAVDPTLRLDDVIPLAEVNRGEQPTFSIIMRVLIVFCAIALLLSAAGVYALMSFTVARRTREIGIRVALGADARRIVAATFSRGLRQVGLGVLAGSIPGSAVIAYGAPEGLEGAGPMIGFGGFVAVALFMICVGTVACYVPARRALRIQPTQALSSDG